MRKSWYQKITLWVLFGRFLLNSVHAKRPPNPMNIPMNPRECYGWKHKKVKFFMKFIEIDDTLKLLKEGVGQIGKPQSESSVQTGCHENRPQSTYSNQWKRWQKNIYILKQNTNNSTKMLLESWKIAIRQYITLDGNNFE